MFGSLKNHYLRFILNLLVLILILVCIDKVAGHFTRQLYFAEHTGVYYRTTYAMDSTMADILVFGSSRANHHYVPEVFEDSLDMTFYNTGRDGNFILYNYAVFKSVLSRYTPKIVILDLRPFELVYSAEYYDRLSSLLPYYSYHPEIQSIITMRGKYEEYKLLSSIYPYNSTLLTILYSFTGRAKILSADNKGYMPLYGTISDTTFFVQRRDDIRFDSVNLGALEAICSLCNDKSIRLMIVNSPSYIIINDSISNQKLSRLASKYNATFIDFQDYAEFVKQPGLFIDRVHLNDKGARLFSSLLAKKLKNQEYH